jgi:hypothetical protein
MVILLLSVNQIYKINYTYKNYFYFLLTDAELTYIWLAIYVY